MDWLTTIAVGSLGAFAVFWLFGAPSTPIEHPLKRQKGSKKRDASIAFAASFNPPHKGHLAIIAQLAREYKNVIAIVAVNPDKTYPVSPQRRQAILKHLVKELALPNVRVEMTTDYAWRYCVDNGIAWLARGIRTFAKDGPAEKFLELQNLLAPVLLGPLAVPVRTQYLVCGDHAELAAISSTVVRKRIERGEDIGDLMPDQGAGGGGKAIALLRGFYGG